MCQFGKSNKILEELLISEETPLIGIRNWKINDSFNNENKSLKSTNQLYIWLPEVNKTDLDREDSRGFYSYLNYSNYNNYYNYNYYNYYYNYNYYNNNYNNYYLAGVIHHSGKIFKYKEGFRSEFAKIVSVAVIDNPKWLESKVENEQKFIKHFRSCCDEISKNYNIKQIPYSEFEKL